MVAVSKRTVTHRPRNRFDQVIDSRGSSSPRRTGMDVAYQEKASEEVNEEWMKDASFSMAEQKYRCVAYSGKPVKKARNRRGWGALFLLPVDAETVSNHD
ncbi:MAG: hypothetical protein ACREUM_03800 [Nitrosospira sp.]